MSVSPFSRNAPGGWMCNGTSSQSNPVDHEKYFKQLLSSLRKQVVQDIDQSFQQIHQQMQERLRHANTHPVDQPATLNIPDGQPATLDIVAEWDTKAVANSAIATGISSGLHVSGTHFEAESSPSWGQSIRSSWKDMLARKDRSKKSKKDEVQEIFDMIDTNGNGELSKGEFLRAFKTDDSVRSFCRESKQLTSLLNPKTFKKAFEKIDKDGNSQIDLGEFREAISNLNEELEKELSEAKMVKEGLSVHAHGAFSQVELFKSGALDKEAYDVSEYYWETGICQAVARSEFFQNFTLGVIVANALYLGVDTDLNNADKLIDADPVFIIMEFLFLAYFLAEWLIRFGAFQKKLDSLKDGWFKFDTCLVLLMIFETLLMPAKDFYSPDDTNAPQLGPLRLLRLLRLVRIVRLLRAFPELATMVKAIAAALRAVMSSFMLIVVLIYVFAIVMKNFLGDDQPTNHYFSTLARSAWTLTIDGIMGDNLGIVLDLIIFRGSFNTIAAVIAFFVFILLAVITIMNMVIGVLCGVVAEVTAAEKEEAEVLFMKKNILVELKKCDDGDGMISEEELNELMTEETSVRVLEALGVDINFLQTLQVMTYEVPEIGVPIPELMEQMLMCRQDTPATMKHLILQQEIGVWMMAHKLMQLENRMYKNLDTRFEILSDSIRAAQNTRMDVDSSEHSCTVSKQLSRDEIAIDESKEAALSKAKAATVVIVREAVL